MSRPSAPPIEFGERRSLVRTIAAFRDEAAVLRRHGIVAPADAIDRMMDAIKVAAVPYLEWIPEGQAVALTGYSLAHFRARRAQREFRFVAELRGDGWWYLRVALDMKLSRRTSKAAAEPQRPNLRVEPPHRRTPKTEET